jgi:hypothetical protein
MRRQVLVIWTAVTLLSVIDLLLCHRLGLQFHDWSRLALAAGVTAGIALFYQNSGRSTHLARATHWTLLWLIFVNAGTVLIYIAAACGGGRSEQFAAWSNAVGDQTLVVRHATIP